MIDERALETAFEILGTAIHKGETGKYPEDDWRICRRVIEAYEAAKWRPIEEATVEDGEVLVAWLGHHSRVFGSAHLDLDRGARLWRTGHEIVRETSFPNALFRTIEPPPQK